MNRASGRGRSSAPESTRQPGEPPRDRYQDIERQIGQLVDIADRRLPTMLRRSGLFCFDIDSGAPDSPRGESVRYSLITLLGLLRRRIEGGTLSTAVEPILDAVLARRNDLGVGDRALLLWVQTRRGSADAERALADLEHAVADGRHEDLLGLEVGWWVTAAAVAKGAGLAADNVLRSGLSCLQSRRSESSPLLRHVGRGARAQYPNFATQIYGLLALAELIRHDLTDFADQWASELADLLVTLRRPNGGWPWLYHANRGSVVEPYEVYSVHQDGMAPMAFLSLAEATGRCDYVHAALDGVAWCFGQNELSTSLVDHEGAVIHRSIRRKGMSDRICLLSNTILAGSPLSASRIDLGRLEINRTCRPYHMGWILEAWSGRDDLILTALKERQ